ncbi:serine/threonine receptor-like kinase NFP [Typha latifolia]|uniref:serine/threonine receptor-like kinase NFP n=1 Tax=Typha latifolia TaxID=4733 RepID=UPI003C2FD085
MELVFLSFGAPLLILLFLHIFQVTTQATNTNTTLFSCSSNSSTSCSTYVIYRTRSPDLLDSGHISDLFGVSRLSIMQANNLTSEEGILLPDQLLLIPTSCGCTGNQSFANITYQIKAGDSFYQVSVHEFENLTDYQAVEGLNPTLEPTELKVGQDVICPLYCKCPTNIQLDRGHNFLITYVWQAGDDIVELSKLMNSSADAIITENNNRNFSSAVAHPILIPVSKPPSLPQLLYNTTAYIVQEKSISHRPIIIAWSMVGIILVLILLCISIFVYRKSHQKKVLLRLGSSLEIGDLLWLKKPRNDLAASPKAPGEKLLTGVSQFIYRPGMFDTSVIMEATKNLDDGYKIGSSFYRANLGGDVFAVKSIKGGATEELKLVQMFNHANLIKLAGVSTSSDGGFFLIYEFAENGSLDKWLLYKKPASSTSVSFLSWRQRLKIALDVANGLQYMHEHTRPSIVHGDIRAGNILLNAEFKAKISNFSMAKPATTGVTTSSDVFAFGVLLLEMLSGKRGMETREGGDIVLLRKEIKMVFQVEEKKGERLRKWMDPNLGGRYPIDGAISLATIARVCTEENSAERPSVGEIVFRICVLAQSYSDSSERIWMPNSDENIITDDVILVR